MDERYVNDQQNQEDVEALDVLVDDFLEGSEFVVDDFHHELLFHQRLLVVFVHTYQELV